MRRALENRILSAYSAAMSTRYSENEFCINEYKEENICLNFDENKWILSIYERGNNKIIASCSNLLDICMACFNRVPEAQSETMKETFLKTLFG